MGAEVAPKNLIPPPNTTRTHQLLMTISIAITICVMLVIGATLWTARNDARIKAEREAANLLAISATHIESQIQLCRFALGLAAQALNDIEFSAISAEARQRLLASIAGGVEGLGALLVLDANGDIAADAASSVPRRGNFADREYFSVHREMVGDTIYISQPYESRLRQGDPSIVLSRRLTNKAGQFAGVVLIAFRLETIRSLFAELDIGNRGVVTLLNRNGKILVREPSSNGKGDVGTDLAGSPNVARMEAAGAGSFQAVAVLDGEERFYTFSHLASDSMLLTVGLSVSDIFAGWRQRALITIGITALICAAIIALTLLLRKELNRRTLAEADLALLAVTDGLTGLANRRHFDETIGREMRRTHRTGKDLALLMIDADRFKQFNDTYGHARGDQILKLLARVLTQATRRPNDLVARYGGEEFAVILPETNPAGAMQVAETIRRQFAIEGAALMPDGKLQCTVSIGIKCVTAGTNLSPAEIIASADAALYQAKNEGRNRLVVAA